MTSVLQQVKNRLAEIGLTVSGVKRAYAQSPQALPHADLPALVCFTGPVLSTFRMSADILEETRKFNLRMYATSAQNGYDGDAERKVEPFLTSVRDVFLKHPGLGTGAKGSPISFVEKMSWIGDSGIMVLTYAGEQYLGTEFSLSVTTIVPITISNFE